MILLYLAIGGAAGTLARYGLGGWLHGWAGTWLPWGTLAVNVIGSFVLGFAMRAAETVLIGTELRAMITIGFCGAFTTFSTYSYETVALVQEGAWTRAGLYAFGSLAAGLAGLVAGLFTAAALLRAGG